MLAGIQALKMRDYSAALRAFERACSAEPNDPRATGYRAWAKYKALEMRSVDGGDAWLTGVAKKNCRTTMQGAVLKARGFDMGYVFLGRMFLDSDMYDEAIGAFKKALRIDADNAEARRFLAETRRRRPQQGLLDRVSGWFGTKPDANGKRSKDRIRPVRVSHFTRRD